MTGQLNTDNDPPSINAQYINSIRQVCICTYVDIEWHLQERFI